MSSVEEGRQWLADEFASGLALALEGMWGERPTISRSAPDRPDGDRFWQQPFSIGASAWLAAPENAWIDIGAKTLGAAGIDSPDRVTAKSTFVEILNQTFAALARAISVRIQSEIACGDGAERESPPEDLNWVALDVALGPDAQARARVAFEDRLAAIVGDRAMPQNADPEPQRRPAALARPQAQTADVNKLDLILDVELPVSVSFGRSQVTLKEAIKLTTGSIIELNRTINEPVEIIVNNCVIARGEVVVVDGNFGVRIQEVVSRQERLRTLY
jgi:flagellar motor switch protein FliN/FliY